MLRIRSATNVSGEKGGMMLFSNIVGGMLLSNCMTVFLSNVFHSVVATHTATHTVQTFSSSSEAEVPNFKTLHPTHPTP